MYLNKHLHVLHSLNESIYDPERDQERQVLSNFQMPLEINDPLIELENMFEEQRLLEGAEAQPVSSPDSLTVNTDDNNKIDEEILLLFEADIKLLMDCHMDLMRCMSELHKHILDIKNRKSNN